jgi:uncharacterized membrane protein YgcG
VRRRAGGPGFPIALYDQLTVAQIKSRLGDLSKGDLRKVRTHENNNKQRKGLLSDLDRRLEAKDGAPSTRRRSSRRTGGSRRTSSRSSSSRSSGRRRSSGGGSSRRSS